MCVDRGVNEQVVLLMMQKMRFHVLEQKYLELLDDGRHMDGLNCLRNQISALKYNTKRVHKLSSYVPFHWKEYPVYFNSHFSTWTWICGYQNVTILDLKTLLFTGPMPFQSFNQQCRSTEGNTHWNSLSKILIA